MKRAVRLTRLARPHPYNGFNFRGFAMQPRNPRKFEPLEFYQLYGIIKLSNNLFHKGHSHELLSGQVEF